MSTGNDISGGAVEKKNEYSKVIETSDGQVPFLKDLWSFYSSKGVKTAFFSVNPENSFELDLLISEGLGCPIRILTNKDSIEQKWTIIQRTLKARSIQEEDKQYDWLKGVEKKWILPKNIHVKRETLGWNTWKDVVPTVAENRVDICKIEGSQEDERVLLYSLLESGYRPGVVLVRYTEDPDANVPSMLVAGHLQMTGYRLMDCIKNWFFYMYDDTCFYDTCSWRTSMKGTKTPNPLVKYLFELYKEQQQSIEEAKKQYLQYYEEQQKLQKQQQESVSTSTEQTGNSTSE